MRISVEWDMLKLPRRSVVAIEALVHVALADGTRLIAEDASVSRAVIGGPVDLRVDGAAAHLFDAAGIGHHRPQS